MKVMQYDPVNEGRHPWREAIRTQLPTIVVALFTVGGFLAGLYVGAHECSFDRAYTNAVEQMMTPK